MSKIAERLKKLMLASMGICILDVLVGLLFFFKSDFSTKICSVVIGAMILIHGLFYLIRYIYDGLGKKVFAIDVIFGVACIIMGIFTSFNLFGTDSSFLVLFGLGLVIIGIENFCFAIKFMKKHEEIFPLVTVISLLIIIMGIVAIINPFALTMLTTRIISYFLIASGLLGCLMCGLFRKRANSILDMYK